MIRVTAFLHHDPARAAEVAYAAGMAGAEQAAATEATSHNAGQTMAFGVFDDVEMARAFGDALRTSTEPLVSNIEVVRYVQGQARLQDVEITGVQRTLLFRVVDGADVAEIARFERQLSDMGRYISAIRNSCLSRVDEVIGRLGPPWTHVWEQEFRSVEGLTGPYMLHAHHWGLVDTWFDVHAPNHIVDRNLVHGICGLERSILGRG